MHYSVSNSMNSTSVKTRRRIVGQGLTEYIIILALVAIASIVAVSFYGSGVKASFLALGADLTGGAPVDKVGLTSANRKAAETATKTKTTLQNYNQ